MTSRTNIIISCFAITIFITAISISCNDIFAPSISSLTITTGLINDFRPVDNVDHFYIDCQKICCSARLYNVHKDVEVTAYWKYVGSQGGNTNSIILHSDKAVSNCDCYVGFTLNSPVCGFNVGKYAIELLIDGKVASSVPFYVEKDISVQIPKINFFRVDPTIIVEGQSSTLSWDVSGATRIVVEPDCGSVESQGKINVSPLSETTYTLFAVNRNGTSTNSLILKVIPKIKEKPDLEIIDFWNTGNILFYRVKNKGLLVSCPCTAALYKNGILESTDYISPLEPGEERVESFASYHFSPRFGSLTGSALQEGTSDAVNMRICLNQPPSCAEASFENNCLDHNFGPTLYLNLLRYAPRAIFENNDGSLSLPMNRDYKKGWAAIGTAQMESVNVSGALLMVPPAASGKWTQARFGIPEASAVGLKPFIIPYKGKFTAKVGLSSDCSDDASIKFIFGMKFKDGIEFLPPVNADNTKKTLSYEVDLSKFAGREAEFILRVESNKDMLRGSAVWADPILLQEK